MQQVAELRCEALGRHRLKDHIFHQIKQLHHLGNIEFEKANAEQDEPGQLRSIKNEPFFDDGPHHFWPNPRHPGLSLELGDLKRVQARTLNRLVDLLGK